MQRQGTDFNYVEKPQQVTMIVKMIVVSEVIGTGAENYLPRSEISCGF